MGFLHTHGSGWWLHMLGAVAIMAVGWWTGWLLTALIINTVLWPVREWWQKVNPNGNAHLRFGEAGDALFTRHVLLEWVPAVAVGFLAYGVAQWAS